MAQQVQRIGGQLLSANLQRELADLAFDTDLLVIKRDGTIGVNTHTTPRKLTVDGTLRSASGSSDPDVIFGNSLTVGDFTISTEGLSVPSGNITLQTTHPNGFFTMGGLGSLNYAVRSSGAIESIVTNGSVGFRSTWSPGMTEAWNNNDFYGEHWYPGPKDSASAPDNDGDRLYQEALDIANRGAPFSQDELDVFDWDEDGAIEADDVLKTLTLNSQFVNGQYFPASRKLSDHPNITALKNWIETYYPDSYPRNLQLQGDPNGTLNVTGNIHATGNITYGGDSITIGDDSTDSARFLAEFKNDIIPDLHNTYKMGRTDDSTVIAKRFNAHIKSLFTDKVVGKDIVYQGINLTKATNVVYVSKGNGNDLNRGTHPAGPVATIEKALELARAEEGTLVYIFSGQYQETFPLSVPDGITIQGESIRSVEITPTTDTQSENCFELEGFATIQDLTVKDYYYDSVNDKGYAFAFAPNFSVNYRSPYVRNITVITKGTTVTSDDPRGYDSGDAGRGALIDGGAVNENSTAATLLFHSCTFMTPGVPCIVMRNGVRVEWLNSFTYFASIGMQSEEGVQGRLLADSTRVYGSELRSIGSACVYGEQGVVADGQNTLIYLINHNFAYIGSGKSVTNDNTLVSTADEVVTTNNAKVYYTSQDQQGNFNVGDLFNIDQENSTTSFDIESIFASDSVVRVVTDDNEIYISSDTLKNGNLQIIGNTIYSTSGDLNIKSKDTVLNFLTDTNVQGNLSTTGDFSIGGNITLGDAAGDTITFETDIDQDLLPKTTLIYNLGNSNKTWRTSYTTGIELDSITISPNSIGTNESNTNLELRADGDGSVYFEDIEIKDNEVRSRFSRVGEFGILETDENVIDIFVGYESLSEVFPNTIMVFDIPVMATTGVTKEQHLHVANILAGYLDNDYNNVVDDALMYAQFSNGLKGIAIYQNSTEEANVTSTLGSWKTRTTSVYANQINLLGDGVNNIRDYTLERILRYFILDQGFTEVYNDLGKTRITAITAAMDTARGGYQAGGIPGYNYPPFAWYTDQTGLNYNELVVEYLYLAISSYNGTNAWRDTELSSYWLPETRAKLETQDPSVVTVIENTNDYNLPLTNPVLDYWKSVTDNLGGTTRDLIIHATNNVEVNSTNHITVPKGDSIQRPNVTGAIRYNTDYNVFEGIVGGGAVSLQGIYDSDRNTYLDLSNNEFTFVSDGVANHTLNGTLLESTGFSTAHKFSIDGNIVSSDQTNGTAWLRSNGTGTSNIETLTFGDSILTDTTNAPTFSFDLTNTNNRAYLKIDNVNGFVIPYGTDVERPTNPEIGHTRWSTDNEFLETYNGTQWINAAGQVEAILEEDVEELAYIWNVILE